MWLLYFLKIPWGTAWTPTSAALKIARSGPIGQGIAVCFRGEPKHASRPSTDCLALFGRLDRAGISGLTADDAGLSETGDRRLPGSAELCALKHIG